MFKDMSRTLKNIYDSLFICFSLKMLFQSQYFLSTIYLYNYKYVQIISYKWMRVFTYVKTYF